MRESVVAERLEWIFPSLREQILGTDDPRAIETAPRGSARSPASISRRASRRNERGRRVDRRDREEARARHRAGPRVLAHQDWTFRHVRWCGNEPTVVYDWDAAEAQVVYTVAYTARCEHAVDVAQDFSPATNARSVLREFARALL